MMNGTSALTLVLWISLLAAPTDLTGQNQKPSDLSASRLVSIASHGSMTPGGRGHPRTSGTFSRVLGHYVREQKKLSLMEALRKMTLLPAQRIETRFPGMKKKGRLHVGSDADITIFDAGRIIDAASYKEPTRPSEAIRYVIVNGVSLIVNGVLQDQKFPGRAIRATGFSAK